MEEWVSGAQMAEVRRLESKQLTGVDVARLRRDHDRRRLARIEQVDGGLGAVIKQCAQGGRVALVRRRRDGVTAVVGLQQWIGAAAAE